MQRGAVFFCRILRLGVWLLGLSGIFRGETPRFGLQEKSPRPLRRVWRLRLVEGR